MILADKIMTLRKKNGWSQEELASQLGVSRQSVSKWESAGSIPELDKILQMAKLFGVSVDYLLKDEMETEEYAEDDFSDSPIRRVSMDEAYAYMQTTQKAARQISLGVTLCVLSPALLIMLGVLSETGVWGISENMAAGIGVLILLLMVAAAVALFIPSGMALGRFEYLQKEAFDTEYGVDGVVNERRRQHEPVFAQNITIGVVMCILSAVPLIFAGAMDASDLICGACVCLLLIIVALAVNIFIREGLERGCYDVLLQIGDHTREKKIEEKKLDRVAVIYWSLVTAGYLAYSFITFRWETSWIVWPVAGVLYGAIAAIFSIANRK